MKKQLKPVQTDVVKVADAKGKQSSAHWWALGAVFVTFVTYLGIFENSLTNWDDEFYVTNKNLLRDLSWAGWKAIFTTPVVSNYHPLTILTLAWNYQMSGLNASSYLITNLLLHLCNVGFVFYFIFQLSKKNLWIALFVAIIFGVHPMHVESVAWVSERKDVLYAFFFLPTLLLYIKYLRQPSAKIYIAMLLLFVLSLLSKPAAVVLPLVLLLLDYFYEKKATKKNILEKIPFFALSLIMGFFTIKIQAVKALASVEVYSVLDRILFACYGFFYYIIKLIIPFELAAFHPFPDATQSLPAIYYFSAIPTIGFIVAIFLYWKKGDRISTFARLFYVINILLVLQLLSVGSAVVAERYTYIPYIGLLFGWSQIVVIWGQKLPIIQKATLPTLIVICLIFSYLSHQQIKTWRNSEILWTNILAYYPNCAKAYVNRGVYYQTVKKQNEKAFSDYNKGIEADPNFANAYENRSIYYLNQLRQPEKALADAEKLTQLTPNSAKANLVHADALTATKSIEKAIAAYTKAITLKPDYIEALNNRGTAYFNYLKNPTAALADFDRAIALEPKQGLYYLNRANCYFSLGDKPKALQSALQAQRLGQAVRPEFLENLK